MKADTRCTCGHILEWHYRVVAKGNIRLGPDGNRCPDRTCACTTPQYDGNGPAVLPRIPLTA